jgi:hypothetical protein
VLVQVLDVVAALYSRSVDDVAEQLYSNTMQLYFPQEAVHSNTDTNSSSESKSSSDKANS